MASCHHAIALQLRKLASDPDSQCFLARDDACVSGIITLLNSDVDRDTLILTLQAVNFLCEPPSNRLHLSGVSGLLLRLITLAESDDAEVGRISGTAVAVLSAAITESTAAAPPRRDSRTSRTSINGANGPSRSRYLYSLCYSLHNGCNSCDEREAVERAIIGVRGVISVSVSAVGVITVYCQKREDGAVNDMTARVAAAVRTVDDALTVESADKENAIPAGLKAPPQSKAPSTSTSSAPAANRALAVSAAFESNTLQARFTAKKKKADVIETKQTAAKGLLAQVSSFFW